MTAPAPLPAFPPFLGDFDPRWLPAYQCDVLVVGAGIAGATAAVAAAEKGALVLVACKGSVLQTNSSLAQGGMAAAMEAGDGVESHVRDTLRVGLGLCDEGVVRRVVEGAAEAVRRLADWGVRFDRATDGAAALSREGGHSRPRVLHARGDGTGEEIQRALAARLATHDRIQVREGVFVRDLLVEDGVVRGALALAEGRLVCVWAERVVIATGGAGQIYRETTNPPVATADGLSLAARAGAVLQDLEFVQFHPTALYIAGAARFLISEAVRGAGAVLRDRHGKRFMEGCHPDADLGPRDVVSRAVFRRMVESGDTNVYLDLSGIPGDVRSRFPGIARICAFFDIDIARDPIPVRPAAHYMIGGIRAGVDGRTSVAGLSACGEAASVGLHGANRLASNSLLEGMVLGWATGEAAAEDLRGGFRVLRAGWRCPPSAGAVEPVLHVEDMLYSLKALMDRNVGIERSQPLLEEAAERLAFWSRYLFRASLQGPSAWELANMLIASTLITRCALERRESRGTHFRADFRERDDAGWLRHTCLALSSPGARGGAGAAGTASSGGPPSREQEKVLGT